MKKKICINLDENIVNRISVLARQNQLSTNDFIINILTDYFSKSDNITTLPAKVNDESIDNSSSKCNSIIKSLNEYKLERTKEEFDNNLDPTKEDEIEKRLLEQLHIKKRSERSNGKSNTRKKKS